MQYGKIVNGAFEPFSGGHIHYNGRVYTNLSETTLIRLGYKPLIEAEPPEEREGYYITPVYAETDSGIVQSYEYREIEEITEMEGTE